MIPDKLGKFIPKYYQNVYLPDGELNPGLPRDRRGYWPLYYRGLDVDVATSLDFEEHAALCVHVLSKYLWKGAQRNSVALISMVWSVGVVHRLLLG